MSGQRSLFDPPDSETPGKVGRHHPGTSREAAWLCQPTFGSQRAVVLVAVAVAGHHGVTVAEVADAMGVSRNQIATRMLELRERGWVLRAVLGHDAESNYVYRTRATGVHTSGIVHVLNPEAREAFDQWVEDGTK